MIHWVKIEGGSFMMGGKGEADGKLIHKVTLKSFMISKTEVGGVGIPSSMEVEWVGIRNA